MCCLLRLIILTLTTQEGTEFSGKSLLSPLARAGSHKAMPGPVIEEGDEEEAHSEQFELGHLQRLDEARKELDEPHLVHNLHKRETNEHEM